MYLSKYFISLLDVFIFFFKDFLEKVGIKRNMFKNDFLI